MHDDKPDSDATPSPAPAPADEATLRKLEYAEKDMDLYAAILGRRPAVVPESELYDEPAPRASVTLTFPIPLSLPKSLSSSRKRGLSRTPKIWSERTMLQIWVRKLSTAAKKRIEEAKMRIAG